MPLNWTKDTSKKGDPIHFAASPNGLSYVIARRNSRAELFAVTDVTDRSSANKLGTGTVNAMKEKAQFHTDMLAVANAHDNTNPNEGTVFVQPSQITQTNSELITPQDAPEVVNDPEPAPDSPEATDAIVDATNPVSNQPEEAIPMARLTDATVQVATMPSVAQKTKTSPAVAKAKAKKEAAKKEAVVKTKVKAKTSTNGTVTDTIPIGGGMSVDVIEVLTPTLTPKKRPFGKLRKVPDPATTAVISPDGIDPEAVFSWAETQRDDFEADGKLLTPTGLIKLATATLEGDSLKTVTDAIKSIYKDEYAKEKADAKGKGNDKPTNDPPRKRANPDMADAKVKDNNFNIPVGAKRSPSGKVYATIFDHKARAVVRWMGQDGWTYDEAVSALTKLDLWKFFKDTKTDHVSNNLASGKRGDKKDGGWVGDVPKLSGEEAKALKALKSKD